MKTKIFQICFNIVIVLITITVQSCKNNIVESVENSTPGRRDYNWTVDTLVIPFNNISNIWGIESKDVWVTGSGGSSSQMIYHYDGIKWTTDGISRPIIPYSLFGFANNDVWIGGQGGLIWHYDGIQLKESFLLNISGYTNVYIVNIWGDLSDDFYALGYAENDKTYKGVILHYYKKQWILVNIPDIKCSFVKIRRAVSESPIYYLKGYQYNSTVDSVKIYQFDGKNLKEIYSSTFNNDQYSDFELVGGKMMFLQGNKICSYKNDSFNPFYNITEKFFNCAFAGRSDKDIFLFMYDGIAHYNGNDVQYLYRFNNKNIVGTGFLICKSNIFFASYDRAIGYNLIFRGELNTK